MKSDKACFVTLTYSPEKVPYAADENGIPVTGSLEPEDVRLFLYRLRKRLKPRKFRYYIVGEYGEKSERPHYHGAFFGMDRADQEHFEAAWKDPEDHEPIGFVDVGDLTNDSAQYIAGYVTKKLSSEDSRMHGRYPEFSRQSNRPGIGASAVEDLLKDFDCTSVKKHIEVNGDLPKDIKVNGKTYPLGRYLMEKLRLGYGLSDGGAPERIRQEHKEKMLAMYASYTADAKNVSPQNGRTVEKVRQTFIQGNAQKVLNKEKRYEIFNQRSKI